MDEEDNVPQQQQQQPKKTIGQWFKNVAGRSALFPNNNNNNTTTRPSSIVPTHLSAKDQKLRESVAAITRGIKSWYFDLKQQLARDFAHLENTLAWEWTLEATRRAWETCVRYMTRERMVLLCNWREPRDMARTLLRSYGMTRAQIAHIARVPQRSPEWFATREGFAAPDQDIYRGVLISSSTVGQWLGDKSTYKADRGFKSHLEALYRKIFDENDVKMAMATQRGTAMEPLIMDQTVRTLRILEILLCGGVGTDISATEVGLEVCFDEPNFGVSSDGRLSFTFEDGTTLHYGMEMKCKADPWTLPYGVIPSEYFDQIQLTMHVLKLPRYIFTCHSAVGFSLEVYAFKREWWQEQMRTLRRRYWSEFWPTFVMKTHDMLNRDEILPTYHYYAKSVSAEVNRYLGDMYGIEAALRDDDLRIEEEEDDDDDAEALLREPKTKRILTAVDLSRIDDDIDYSTI